MLKQIKFGGLKLLDARTYCKATQSGTKIHQWDRIESEIDQYITVTLFMTKLPGKFSGDTI